MLKKIFPKPLRHFLWWRYYYLKRWIKGKINSNKLSYSLYNIEEVNSIFNPENYDIEYDVSDYVNHKFSLLGIKSRSFEYDKKYPGFEGKYYSFSIKWDKNGNFLSKIVNRNNLKTSKRIWRLLYKLNPGYIPIDWQRDFKSGYRWDSKKHFLLINYGKQEGVDVKIPWELARFQHLIQMGLAYKKSKDKKILLEFQSQILDFIATNPPEFGVNWVCTMDVAIRVANWMISYGLFKSDLDEEFKKFFFSSLYDHGRFIFNNLENKGKFNSNHYLSDISGLFILALSLKDNLKEADVWFRFAANELKKEIREQIYDDGTDFEGSTYYHRLVLELLFYPVYFARINGEDINVLFGTEYLEKLKKIFDSLFYLLKPDGRMPQIGDNDSGQFIKWYDYDVQYMGYLLLLGSKFFNEINWKIKFFEQKYDRIDEKLLKILMNNVNWEELIYKEYKNIKFVKEFKQSGWYIYRNGLIYLIFTCGPVGQKGVGGHSHNHQLSFELFINGHDIIVDPGTYVYTPSPYWRNYFRSIKSHSAPFIEDREPDKLSYKNVFYKEDNSYCKGEFVVEGIHKIIFKGEHQGFGKPVKRVITIEKGHIIVEDFSDFDDLQSQIILSPGGDYELKGTDLVFNKEKVTIRFDNLIKAERKFYSSSYGKKETSVGFVYKGKMEIFYEKN